MGRPFVFKLEKILEFRQQAEDQAKLAFSRAKQAVQAQQAHIDSLEAAATRCLEDMAALQRMTQAELWLWTNWRDRIELDKKTAQVRLHELEKHLEQRRHELVTKARERKLLDKLRVKQAERHDVEEQRKEQNTFDEAATLRFGRTPY